MNFKTLINNTIKNYTYEKEYIDLIIKNIRTEIKNYILTNNIKSLVVGVSGGLDSAVISALCQEKYTGVPLITVSIPMNSTEEHNERAKWVGETFGTTFMEFKEFESKKTYNKIQKLLNETDKISIFDEKNDKLLLGNIKARLRMITLYDLARKNNGIVLSTDNYSEYFMGFWTICGDVGDYAPIQQIYKGLELPQIAYALNIREDIIIQKPSDGLKVTKENTDEKQLGANYIEVDTIMIAYLEDKDFYKKIKLSKKESEKIESVIKRYETSHFKRNGTIILNRDDILNPF